MGRRRRAVGAAGGARGSSAGTAVAVGAGKPVVNCQCLNKHFLGFSRLDIGDNHSKRKNDFENVGKRVTGNGGWSAPDISEIGRVQSPELAVRNRGSGAVVPLHCSVASL